MGKMIAAPMFPNDKKDPRKTQNTMKSREVVVNAKCLLTRKVAAPKPSTSTKGTLPPSAGLRVRSVVGELGGRALTDDPRTYKYNY